MNTTALTSDPGYTVLSSVDRDTGGFEGISVVLLSRGGKPFRREQIRKLMNLKVREIISIEENSCGLDGSFPEGGIKCISTHRPMTTGEQINIAVREAAGSHILVMWDDMELQIVGSTGRLFDMAAKQSAICSIPVLMNSRKESIPIRLAPIFSNRKLEIVPLGAVKNGSPTLYPFDYCGIYNRKKFLLSEGYDPAIRSAHWQKLDFGMRAFLWGEEILCYTGIKIAYLNDIPREDSSIDPSYGRFFLKNLALQFRGDSCGLPLSRILSFHIQSGLSLFHSLRDYRDAVSWVRTNRYRFRMDPYSLTELWELE
jgi:hypothetical protein